MQNLEEGECGRFRRKGKWRQARGLYEELVNRNQRHIESPAGASGNPAAPRGMEDGAGRMWDGVGRLGGCWGESGQRLERDDFIIPRMPTLLPIPLLAHP